MKILARLAEDQILKVMNFSSNEIEVITMGYRQTYFENTPDLLGKYRCCRCGNWFKKEEIDVDHRIPKKHGGTDDLSNLQGMCRHCNRSKKINVTVIEIAQTLVKGTFDGTLGNTLKSAAVQGMKNALGIKYRR